MFSASSARLLLPQESFPTPSLTTMSTEHIRPGTASFKSKTRKFHPFSALRLVLNHFELEMHAVRVKLGSFRRFRVFSDECKCLMAVCPLSGTFAVVERLFR